MEFQTLSVIVGGTKDLVSQSVQLLSHVQLFATLWTAASQASLSITNSQSLLKLMSYHVGDAIQRSHPLSSPFPPASIFPSIRVFSNESVLRIRWPKYWSFLQGASVLPVNIQDWSPLGWTGWISLQSKGLSRVLSSTTVRSINFFGTEPSLWSNSHSCT